MSAAARFEGMECFFQGQPQLRWMNLNTDRSISELKINIRGMK